MGVCLYPNLLTEKCKPVIVFCDKSYFKCQAFLCLRQDCTGWKKVCRDLCKAEGPNSVFDGWHAVCYHVLKAVLLDMSYI